MSGGTAAKTTPQQFLRRKDVLAGLMFIGVAAFGLWASRNYPIGTAVRMGTGYVPRLLCWILLGLGCIVFIQGFRASAVTLEPSPPIWRSVILIPASLVVFAYAIGPLGVIAAIVLLVVVGSLAGKDSRLVEVIAAALVLIGLTLLVFVWGIGLPIPVWPEWW